MARPLDRTLANRVMIVVRKQGAQLSAPEIWQKVREAQELGLRTADEVAEYVLRGVALQPRPESVPTPPREYRIKGGRRYLPTTSDKVNKSD